MQNIIRATCALLFIGAQVLPAQNRTLPMVGTCPVFPINNVWNTPVDTLPVHPLSSQYIANIGVARGLHPDFDSIGDGIPYVTVPGTQPKATVSFLYDSESDHAGYPIPNNAPIEHGSDGHLLVVDSTNCILYEIGNAQRTGNLAWAAGAGAIFNLRGNVLRPDGFTSTDAAGLPVFPGLVRYDEVAAGAINHALRITVPHTQKAHVWPARHDASYLRSTAYPPMGTRLRLKASFNITSYPADVQVVLKALKKYGAFVADNGSAWYLTGVPDARWNDNDMHKLGTVLGSNFEAVDESSLKLTTNSAQVPAGAYH